MQIKKKWKLREKLCKFLKISVMIGTFIIISTNILKNLRNNSTLSLALNIEDEYWQVLETSNGTIKIFNAYYDTRQGPMIRILAFINRVEPEVKTFCKLWYDGDDQPCFSETFEYKVLWHKAWGWNYKGSQPYLISCRNPREDVVPSSMTLVENILDLDTNHLKIIYNLPKDGKRNFGVCVKESDFMNDQSMQIIEWVEILLLLGAEKIFVYVIKLHPNVIKTLKYYESLGKVEVEMMRHPKELTSTNESKITQMQQNQNEIIPLNDCFYKHLFEFEFLIPIDIDEFVLPVKKSDKTWSDLMDREIEKRKKENLDLFSGYSVRNVFFLSDNIHEGEVQSEVPENFRFLQSVHRAKNFSHKHTGEKTFQNTARVLAMHNHSPLKCLHRDICDCYHFKTKYAQLNHYRRDCENYPKHECEDFKINTVEDKKLWRYKKEVIENVKKALDGLTKFRIVD